MGFALSLIAGALLSLAERLVPEVLRHSWREEYRGGLWTWTLEAARSGAPDGTFALWAHLRSAWREAIRARFRTEQGHQAWLRLSGSPTLCIALCLAVLISVAIFSHGFRVSRRLAHGLDYRDPQRIVVLAEGPPYFGIRLGFRPKEVEVLRKTSQSLDGIATYTWRTTQLQTDGRTRNVLAASVSEDFFQVLGVAPTLGSRLDFNADQAPGFLASNDFWRTVLRADPEAIGRQFKIAGRSTKLVGVLPRDFSFLSQPIDVWLPATEDPPVPAERWWLGLKGAIARLKLGVSPPNAERELRWRLVAAGLGRRNYQVQASPIEALVFRAYRSYAADLLVCLAALFAWATFNLVRDRVRSIPWNSALRFWGFFVAKASVLLIALFFYIVECTNVTSLGITGGVPARGGGAAAVWVFYLGIGLILLWAWRDQVGRCRVCLNRLREPLRIGVPGHVLLETAGQEVMCPKGHGALYTSSSVLGAEMSNRWLTGF